jgi:hypothetical protein
LKRTPKRCRHRGNFVTAESNLRNVKSEAQAHLENGLLRLANHSLKDSKLTIEASPQFDEADPQDAEDE